MTGSVCRGRRSVIRRFALRYDPQPNRYCLNPTPKSHILHHSNRSTSLNPDPPLCLLLKYTNGSFWFTHCEQHEACLECDHGVCVCGLLEVRPSCTLDCFFRATTFYDGNAGGKRECSFTVFTDQERCPHVRARIMPPSFKAPLGAIL